MASPLSVGDSIQLAKIAWQLARAFTKGRKSAPAEFREVENQLYSLSAALHALKDARCNDKINISIDPSALPETSQAARSNSTGEQTLDHVLKNCGETLSHLEEVVRKYGRITEIRDTSQPVFERWSKDLVRNWKKVAWTTEHGDLATLRSQLMVHTNSLNLILGIVVNSQATRIEDTLQQNTAMLKEIHSWYIDNLKNISDTAARTTPAPQNLQVGQQGTPVEQRRAYFEIYVDYDRSQERVCEHAVLYQDWDKGGRATTHLFDCRCADFGQNSLHKARLESFGLSHITYPIRLMGDSKSWMLFKVAERTSNRLLPVVLKNLPSSYISEFEDAFVRRLATARAAVMLKNDMDNMLAYTAEETGESRFLISMGQLKDMKNYIDTISFTAGQKTYSRESIESLQLLQYKALGGQGDPAEEDPDDRNSSGRSESAEFIFFYEQNEANTKDDVVRTVLTLKRNTPLSLDDSSTQVKIENVDCASFAIDRPTGELKNASVTVQLTTTEAARKLYKELEEMRMELFISSLRYPRADERVLLHLQAAQVHCEEIYIPDAEITIVRDADAKYRLIIVSHNGCTLLSQILSDDFFNASQEASSIQGLFTAPTWLVQLEDDGQAKGVRKVYRYQNGFQHLSFSDIESDRMFELARNTITKTMPIRSLTI